MGKYSVPFVAFTLVAWTIGGSWWYANFYHNSTNKKAPVAFDKVPSFELKYGEFRIFSKTSYYFIKNQSRAHIPENTNDAFYNLVGFINEKESRIITITGLYNINESYEGEYQNLGLERAASLENRLLRLGLQEGKIKIKSLPANLVFDKNNRNYKAAKIEIEKAPFTDNTQIEKIH